MSSGKVRQGGVFVEIGADAKAFFATLARVNKSIGQAGKAMAMMGARLTAVGAAITAPLAGAAAVFASVGDQVQKMAARTGLSAEAVSGLGFAAEQSGTDMATLEKGIRTMQRSLDDAATKGGAAAKAFQRLGLDVASLSQMSPEDQFTAIAEALSQVQDPGQRAALAMQVFGRAGAALIPLLNGGAAGIAELRAEAERLGLVMDQDAADSAAALTDAMNSMTKAVRAIMVNVGGALAPMFTKFANIVSMLAGQFSKFVKENARMAQIAFAVGAAIVGLGTALTAAGFAVMGMSAALSALASPFLLIGRLAAGLISVAASVATSLLAMSASIAVATTQSLAAVSSFVLSAVGQFASYVSAAAMAGVASLSSAAKVGVAWTVSAAVGVASFAVAADIALGGYVAKTVAIVASTVASTAAIAAAWIGPPIAAVSAFVVSVATAVAGYVSSLVQAVSATVARVATIAAAWASTAAAGIASFVLAVDLALGGYLVKTSLMVAGTIASAAKIAAAWAGQALLGVMSFVGSALSGIASYLGGLALAVAGTIASTAAMAAAWLAPMAPLIAIGAAVGALIMNLGKVGPMISGAFGAVGGRIGQVANSIAGPLRVAVQDAAIVMEDLGATAGKTFQGISDAITAGNLAGAMDMLWAGLQAGWLRGVEALMSYVDPFVTALQNTFTYLAANVMNIWESMNSGIAQALVTIKGVILGLVDNIVNGVMAAFDAMVAAVRKSWNWVQSFIVKGYDLAKENQKVDSEMTARAAQRGRDRPGLAGRMEQASQERKAIREDAQRAIDGRNAAADATAAGRFQRNDERAAARREATLAAEARVDELAAKLAEEAATAVEERGKKTAEKLDLDGLADSVGGKQADVAGTFSAAAVGGMGFGQSLAQKQLDVLRQIEQNTSETEGALVGD